MLRKVQQVHMAVNRYLEEEKAKAEQEQRRSEVKAYKLWMQPIYLVQPLACRGLSTSAATGSDL